MKKLIQWTKERPEVVYPFAVSFISLAVMAAVWEEWFWYCVIVYACAAGALAGIIWTDCNRICLVLAALLCLGTTAQAQDTGYGGDPKVQDAGGCAAAAVAVVVVAAGGYVVYKLVKFCQKHFTKDENSITNQPSILQSESTSYGAAFCFSPLGSCADGYPCSDQYSPTVANPVTFSLRLSVQEGPGSTARIETRLSTYSGLRSHQSWPEFVAECGRMGLTLTDYPSPPSFSVNGKPSSGDQSPLSWDTDRQLVRYKRGSRPYYTIEVLRSPDMRQWVPLLRTEVEAGTTLLVRDTQVRGQQFYRVNNQLSD